MNGSKEVNKSLQHFLDTCLHILGDQYQFIASNQGKELVDIAKIHAAQVEMIVAIGGDGTLNEISEKMYSGKNHSPSRKV